jgi:predicted nucleic acid-binding Zn ribbon protein
MSDRQTRRTRGMAPGFSAVNSFLQSQELASMLRPHLAKVHWEGVVGPQVAGVTQVESVRDGVLFVRVKNSVWANELTLLKEDMLRRLNSKLGGRVLTDIHFKASGLARDKKKPADISISTPTKAELARIVLSEEVRARVETALIGVTEEALRGRIRAVMLHAARTDEWKRRQGWSPCPRCGALAPPPDTPEAAPLCALCRAGVGLG